MKNLDFTDRLLIAILCIILMLKLIAVTKTQNEIKKEIRIVNECLLLQDSINGRLKEGIMFSIKLSNYHTDDIIQLENSIKQ